VPDHGTQVAEATGNEPSKMGLMTIEACAAQRPLRSAPIRNRSFSKARHFLRLPSAGGPVLGHHQYRAGHRDHGSGRDEDDGGQRREDEEVSPVAKSEWIPQVPSEAEEDGQVNWNRRQMVPNQI